MNIDEWLAKLVERHAGLAQSVELLTIENRQNANSIAKLEVLVREITGGIRDLVTVVRSHEGRISGLEEAS